MNSTPKTGTFGRFHPWLIGAALFAVYTALAQANLTFDGAAFITWYYDFGMPHPQHPLFGYYFNLCLKLGRASGLTLVQAGLLQSALTASTAVALYSCWLRRLKVGAGTAVVFTLLLGLTGTVIEIATTVELYGVALLAVVLSLHAWLGEARAPKAIGAIALWFACLAVVMLHVGWALWVLAVYLSLAWHERARRRRALVRLGEGAAVALALGLWFTLDRQFAGTNLFNLKTFFAAFAPDRLDLSKPFQTLFAGLIANGGLLLFPAIAAAFRERRAYPALFGLGAAATVVFFLLFGFWPADRGEFYLPVLAVWGFFAARAADDWMCNGQSARPFMLAALAYAALLLAASRMQESWLPALVFWVYAAASARWGWVQARGADGVSTTGPRLLPRFVLLGLTLALYLPPALGQLRPTAATLRLNLFRSVAPPGARLVTALSPHMAFAQTGHPAQAPLANAFLFDVHNTRKFLALWVEAARAGGAPIWMDEPSWKNRDKIFNFPGEQPIPWQDLAVVQYHADGEVFYELKAAKPKSVK